jgi:cyclopropane-fatty-acyl-phospholipid synthase
MNTIATTRQDSAQLSSSHIRERSARTLLFALLAKLEHGQLNIRDRGNVTIFGSDSQLSATVDILDPAAYAKILMGGSIGAGESYIDGLWNSDDLTSLIRIAVLNMSLLDEIEDKMGWLLRPVRRVKHFLNRNTRSGSRKNILAHYDLGNDLYRAFLDPSLMYSSAIYPTAESSLDEAAEYKLDYICRKLNLTARDHVIEIGSGWGGFAIHAASRYGCKVSTTTISEAQYAEATRRVREAGLEDRITLLKRDYRDLEGSYDKLVSIEMIEAVGYRYLPLFFQKCGSLLKSGGMMLLQAITIQDQKFTSYLGDVDFIQKHIFPGGCLTSNSHMLQLISEKSDMVVRSIEDFGFDYARTLKDWRLKFVSAFPKLEKKGYDERFKRLWEFYLSYCEGGFMERSISVVQLISTRPGNRETVGKICTG